MPINIRRLRETDWATYRALRLRALEETPSAFCASLEVETARTEDEWRRRMRDAEAGVRAVGFIAEHGSAPSAMVMGLRGRDGDPAVELVSMWVAPEARGGGLGRRLVHMVVDWARSVGAAAVTLEVHEANDSARRLHEACGFVLTGRANPFVKEPPAATLEMRRPV